MKRREFYIVVGMSSLLVLFGNCGIFKSNLNTNSDESFSNNANTNPQSGADGKDGTGGLPSSSTVDSNVKIDILYASSDATSSVDLLYPGTNIYDENIETRWSRFGLAKFVDVYLSKQVSLSYVQMAFFKSTDRSNYFELFGALGDSDFLKIGASRTSSLTEDEKFQKFNISGMTVDRLRIVGNGNSKSEWNSLLELQVYGIPLDEVSQWTLNPFWEDLDDPTIPEIKPPIMTELPSGGIVSTLFGENGELWDKKGRLTDFSFAGYRRGKSIPTDFSDNFLSVLDYGAIANDGVDDSVAIKLAIEDASGKNKVVYLPNGTYELDQPIIIRNKSNWILKGQSRDGVIFKVDEPLCVTDDTCGTPRKYSFSGGFIEVRGSNYRNSSNFIADVSGSALRGETALTISYGESSETVKVGDLITLTLKDPSSQTLQKHLHGDHLESNIAELTNKVIVVFTSKVVAVSGNAIEIERPLPSDVRPEWEPKIYQFKPTVREVGLQDFTIKMKLTQYKGHFDEPGYNGIMIRHIADSWISNVKILNADYGINVARSQFTTLKQVVIGVTSKDRLNSRIAGHHAITLDWGGDNLITEFDIGREHGARFVHGLTLDWTTRSNVFMNGRGYNISLDHHGSIPYQNLFTNIDVGLGTVLYNSGGAVTRLPNSAAYNVYWNIKADVGKMPCHYVGRHSSFVSVPRYNSCDNNWHQEDIPSDKIHPQNLYEAQKTLRSTP